MAYEKNNWQSGDIVTSAKLNHMEDGIAGAGGVMIIRFKDADFSVLDKTWQEIYDAANRGEFCFIREVNPTSFSFNYVAEVGSGDSYYVVSTNDNTYVSATSDGYPTLDS